MGSGLQRSRLLFRCQPCWHGSGWNCLPPWRFWVPCSALFFGQLYWPRLRRWRLVRPCRDWGRVGQLCWLLSCWDSGIIRGGVRSPSLSSLPRLRSPFRPVPPCSTEGCPMDGQLRWSSSVAPRDGQRRWPGAHVFLAHDYHCRYRFLDAPSSAAGRGLVVALFDLQILWGHLVGSLLGSQFEALPLASPPHILATEKVKAHQVLEGLSGQDLRHA